MIEPQPTKAKTDFLKMLPGIFISLAAIALIFFIVDWGEVALALGQAQYGYFFLSLPVYLISYLLRAMAWHNILQKKVSLKDVFFAMHAGYLLNNVLPLRLGELGRAFLVGRRGLGFWRVFSSILIERAFDMTFAAGLLLGTLPFVMGASQSGQVAVFIGSLVLAGLGILHLLARNQQWALNQFQVLSHRWPVILKIGEERIQGFLEGLAALAKFSSFGRVFLWMLLSWGTAVIYHFLLMRAFIPATEVLWAAFGMATVSLGVAVPSSPSYVGVYEGAWIGVLALFGVSASIALAFALAGHLLHVVITTLFGTYALSQEGETLGMLFQKIRRQRSES